MAEERTPGTALSMSRGSPPHAADSAYFRRREMAGTSSWQVRKVISWGPIGGVLRRCVLRSACRPSL